MWVMYEDYDNLLATVSVPNHWHCLEVSNMPDFTSSLLELPLSTLIVFVGGYLGYKLAYMGFTASHKTLDLVFLTFGFGVISKVIFEWLIANNQAEWLAFALAVAGALIVGAFWRVVGRRATRWFLRKINISNSDGTQSVFERLRLDQHHRPTEVVVRKKDGSRLMSSNVAQFHQMPFGPFIYGDDGSVGIYITDYWCEETQKWRTADWTIDEDPTWGASMTFVHASEIAEFEVRHQI